MDEKKRVKRKRSEVVDAEVFVARLRQHMELKGLTQAELADRADLSRSALTMFFNGERKPSADALLKLADALDVSTDYLLGRCEESEISDLIRHESILEIARLYMQLSARDQQRVSDMVRLMVSTAGSTR